MKTLDIVLKPTFGRGLSILLCAIIGRIWFGTSGMIVGVVVGLLIDLGLRQWRLRRGDQEFAAQEETLREGEAATLTPLWFGYWALAFLLFEVGYAALIQVIFAIQPESAAGWMAATGPIYAALASLFWGYDKFAVELPQHGLGHLVPLFQHVYAVSWAIALLFFLAPILRLPQLVGRAARLKYDPENHHLLKSQIILYSVIVIFFFALLFPFSILFFFTIPIAELAKKGMLQIDLIVVPAALSMFFLLLAICLVLFVALLVPKRLALRAVRDASPPEG